MHFSPKCAVAALALFALTPSVRALTINLDFDSSVTSLPNAADYEAATTYAAHQYEALFSDPISINITVAATSDPSVLGQNSDNLLGTLSYGSVVAALASDASPNDPTDTAAVASLGAVDPTGGAGFWVTRAQAKALSLIPSDSANDGTFIFGLHPQNQNNPYTLDPNNRAVAGKFDFIGIAEQEISEVMGRVAGLGQTIGNGPGYLPLDLFRYSADGQRSLNPVTSAFFSLDGATNLATFNSSAGGDPSDWNTTANDAFNAATSTGVENSLSSNDIAVMDALGYDLGTDDLIPAAIPEPVSVAIVSCGMLGLLIARRKRSAAVVNQAQ
jgi:hypothetical protein